MVVIVQFNPELAKSTPNDVLPKRSSARVSLHNPTGRPGSISSRNPIVAISQNLTEADFEAEEDDEEAITLLIFLQIPRNITSSSWSYVSTGTLLRCMIQMSTTMIKFLLVFCHIQHIELLNECALRWRIWQTYRAGCCLDLIKHLFERNEVPLDCVPEALGRISKVMNEISFEKWTINDVCSL